MKNELHERIYQAVKDRICQERYTMTFKEVQEASFDPITPLKIGSEAALEAMGELAQFYRWLIGNNIEIMGWDGKDKGEFFFGDKLQTESELYDQWLIERG